MDSRVNQIVVASNLGAGFDERLRRLPLVSELISLADGSAWPLPPHAEILLFIQRPGSGGRQAPRPSGWPGQLRAVQCAMAGLDQYPDWLFEVPQVASARGSNAEAIAEYVLAALLSYEKRMPQIWQDGQRAWPSALEVSARPLGTLAGKTLGLIGWGAIAQAVARLAAPLGMRILACRRRPAPAGESVALCTLDEVLAQADHVVLALALTKETLGLIDARRLHQMKPGAHLINVARGDLIDQGALEAALRSGQLGGATLDVTTPEPLPAGASLYTAPGMRISAHVSWSAPQTLSNVAQKIVDNLSRFCRNEPLLDVVDPELRY